MKFLTSRNYLLAGILVVAMVFRFWDINWDQGMHLHPDERFLTMVGTALKPPGSISQYLNPQTSLLNPANVGYQFYVYGTFPVFINTFISNFFGTDNYADFTWQGRLLSGIADVFVVLLVYEFLVLCEKEYAFSKQVKYWGAFLYAIAVLPIQLSHFFTVDTFLNVFLFAAFYFLFRFSLFGKLRDLLISGLCLGLATGSKETSIYMVPLLGYFLLSIIWEKRFLKVTIFNKKFISFKGDGLRLRFGKTILLGVVYSVIVYLATRFSDPYIFQSGNILDPHISNLLLSNLQALSYWSSPAAWYPPSVQWLSKTPVIFSVVNLSVFGLGLAYFILTIAGIVILLMRFRKLDIWAIIVWTIAFFLYQSSQFVQTMRYFIFLYPFFAVFAAVALAQLYSKWGKIVTGVVLILVLVWPLMFFSIYTKIQSRVSASFWMINNIPSGSVVLNEYWDDPLPLQIPQASSRVYTGLMLPVFDPDTTKKWATMDAMLARGNYLILSSNRGWGSIPTVPSRYPQMTQFYKNLFAGKTNYKKVADFTSYPSLSYLGIPITFPDDWAEEAFTVYDHPHVMIFKNTNPYKNPGG